MKKLKPLQDSPANYRIAVDAYNRQRLALGITHKLLGHSENVKYLTPKQIKGITPHLERLDDMAEQFYLNLNKN